MIVKFPKTRFSGAKLQEMRAAFGLFDRDGDGTISVKVNYPSLFSSFFFLNNFLKLALIISLFLKELGSVLKTMGHQATEEMLHKMIKVREMFDQDAVFW